MTPKIPKCCVNLTCPTCKQSYLHPKDVRVKLTGTWPRKCPSCTAAEGAELLAALEGAQSALRKALPFCPPDKEAVYIGEWLGEVNEAIAKAKGK